MVMSHQRMKGQGNQVSNGPKEQLGAGEGATGSEEFEPWRSQQQNSAAHTAYPSVPISTATDLYNMSTAGYYGSGGTYPYQTFGVGDGTWSNGTDPMTQFLSSYPQETYSMDAMFGHSTTFPTQTSFGQPSSFNYFPNNGDYNTWGNLGQRKYEDYYRENMYQQVPETLKNVEQAMQILDIKSSSDSNKDPLTASSASGGSSQAKKTTWASIASQPAKPQLPIQNQGLKKKGPGMPPGPIIPGKHNMDIGTWDTSKPAPPPLALAQPPPMPAQPPPPKLQPPAALQPPPSRAWSANTRPPPSRAPLPTFQPPALAQHLPPPLLPPLCPQAPPTLQSLATHPVLDELKVKNNYNPHDFDLGAPNARFFVIKSYSEDDIHRSIKYEIWCSTEHGNKRLDQAWHERDANQGAIYLLFSVNGSGHFCGMAQMVTPVDYNANSSVWSQDKWKGQFKVRWIYVKDVPNVQLRHIRLENNENKPVTNSRDTQEVPHPKGLQVLRIMHSYRHSTSIFDDFIHYEKRQEEEDNRKQPVVPQGVEKQQQQQQQQQQQHQQHHHEGEREVRDNRDRGHERERRDHRGEREHRGRGGNHERDFERENHRQGGHRDHHGGHHRDRGEVNRGRGGRGGRN